MISFVKKIFVTLFIFFLLSCAALFFWLQQPLLPAAHPPIAFDIKPGISSKSISQQIAAAGVATPPWLFTLLIRVTGNSAKIKAGAYEATPGMTPLDLLDKLVRGDFKQASLAVIEGWTFRQMRAALAAHPDLKHDTLLLSDTELLAQIAPAYAEAEGLFFPDTYLFPKGSSDWEIYKQAHAALMQRLEDAWVQRAANLPYRSSYEALIMASIVEKETGQTADRAMIAGVFVNRLKLHMPLQTDPTVIYGMAENYQGNIRKRDLQTDTRYNTYLRTGLPPTPIALPGAAALNAALHPARTDALYFVARGDGSSEFSASLDAHNRAVNKYQR